MEQTGLVERAADRVSQAQADVFDVEDLFTQGGHSDERRRELLRVIIRLRVRLCSCVRTYEEALSYLEMLNKQYSG